LAVVQSNFCTFNKQTAVKRECILIDLDITTLYIRDQYASSAPSRWMRIEKRETVKIEYRSVAMLSFAMEDRSSVLVAALMLVKGVLIALPGAEPVGVEVDVEASPLTPAAFLAAFSANRFCLDAEGGIERTCPAAPQKFHSL
jgi:hypothetical protein